MEQEFREKKQKLIKFEIVNNEIDKLDENVVVNNKNLNQSVLTNFKFADEKSIHERITKALNHNQFTFFTKIQKIAYPIIQEGHNCDIKAETGSGKTLSYMVN